MAENERGKQSEYRINASQFKKNIQENIVPVFETLQITVSNMTKENKATLPRVITDAASKNDNDFLIDLLKSGSETWEQSGRAIQMSVTIKGDNADTIQRATDLITDNAASLNGKQIYDSLGSRKSSLRTILQKLRGRQPEDENFPDIVRFLGYLFK